MAHYNVQLYRHVCCDQNVAARVVTRTKEFDHITPVRKELHWLPVQECVAYEVLLLCFKALHNQGPCYIADMLHPYVPPRKLGSSSSNQLEVPKVRTRTYGERAFSVTAPAMYTILRSSIKDCQTTSQFKSSLKTCLFHKAYE
jgi:hypothetical protein